MICAYLTGRREKYVQLYIHHSRAPRSRKRAAQSRYWRRFCVLQKRYLMDTTFILCYLFKTNKHIVSLGKGFEVYAHLNGCGTSANWLEGRQSVLVQFSCRIFPFLSHLDGYFSSVPQSEITKPAPCYLNASFRSPLGGDRPLPRLLPHPHYS